MIDKETHVGVTPDGIEYGVSSMQGWRVHMEDAHICEPNIYALEVVESEHESETDENKQNKIELPGHSLFAVFDGHGGTFAAEYAALNMCRVLSREPAFVQYATFHSERAIKETELESKPTERAAYIKSGLDALEEALRNAFINVDAEILKVVQGMHVPDANLPYHPILAPPPATAAITTTNPGSINDKNQLLQHPNAPTPNDEEDAGTTAVMVLVTPQWIVCANAGDSRSVFSKGGHKAVPLSYDHKPDDEEEERRIRSAGGYVAGGRVEGDLAVSRGLGDFRFKDLASSIIGTSKDRTLQAANGQTQRLVDPDDQKVSPVPDIIVQHRNMDTDEFIIVACDGIWDVQSNYECVACVQTIFEEGEADVGLVCEEVRRCD